MRGPIVLAALQAAAMVAAAPPAGLSNETFARLQAAIETAAANASDVSPRQVGDHGAIVFLPARREAGRLCRAFILDLPAGTDAVPYAGDVCLGADPGRWRLTGLRRARPVWSQGFDPIGGRHALSRLGGATAYKPGPQAPETARPPILADRFPSGEAPRPGAAPVFEPEPETAPKPSTPAEPSAPEAKAAAAEPPALKVRASAGRPPAPKAEPRAAERPDQNTEAPAAEPPAPAAAPGLAARLPTFPISYNRPSQIAFDSDTTLSLVVSVNGTAADSLGALPGEKVSTYAHLSDDVVAELVGDPTAVRITPRQDREQRIADLGDVVWVWDVRALTPEPQTLTLKLSAKVPIAGRPTLVPVRTYTDRFTVQIDPVSKAKWWIGQIDPIWKWLGLGTPVVLVGAVVTFFRRRRSQPAAARAPS